MSEKQIHIVFQVLNWLHSDLSIPYKLLPNECRLLINFASHRGIKGIYPSVPTLMKELKLSRSQILRIIKSLEQKDLISINRKIGISNSYFLTIPFEKLSTTRVTHDTGSVDEPVSSTTPVPVSPTTPHPCHPRHPNNKEITKKNNREALSNFVPNEENTILAKDLQVDLTENVQTFIHRHKGDKTQFEFGIWLKENRSYLDRIKISKKPIQQEPYSAVNNMPFYESSWKYDAIKHDTKIEPVVIEKLPSFKEQLRINKQKQGSKTNETNSSTNSTRNNSR